MKGVGDRAAFVRFAAATPNANIAFFRQRQAEMYTGYHKSVAPLTSFVSLGELAAARTGSGALVFCAPLDYLVWTEPMGRFITASNKVIEQAGAKEKQLWVTGALSAVARNELENRGGRFKRAARSACSSGRRVILSKRNPRTRAGILTVICQLISNQLFCIVCFHLSGSGVFIFSTGAN